MKIKYVKQVNYCTILQCCYNIIGTVSTAVDNNPLLEKKPFARNNENKIQIHHSKVDIPRGDVFLFLEFLAN